MQIFAIFCMGSPKSYARMGSTAVPSRNERYEEFLGCANNGTKLFKIKQNYSFPRGIKGTKNF